jgi:hypothetical protein
MAVEIFRVVAIDETHCWDADLLAKHHIAVAFGVYAIREGEATHCCSMSADSWAMHIENAFIFDFDLDPSLRGKVIDEYPYLSQGDYVLEDIRRLPGNEGLENEGLEDCYFSYIDPKTYDRRFLSAPVKLGVDARPFRKHGGLKSREYADAVWEDAREYFSGNGYPCIPVLEYDGIAYREYLADLSAKHRAENRAPLPFSINGDDFLPLFVAAAKRMTQTELLKAGWLSEYEAGHYRRHPEELAEADEWRLAGCPPIDAWHKSREAAA